MIFHDRHDAGRQLAERLSAYRDEPDLLVLALPRGGVVVGYEVARALGAPLDVLVVRKLGFPGHDELAMGAIASGGVRFLNQPVLHHADVPMAVIDAVTAREAAELERREALYRAGRPPLQVQGRTVLLVDDGVATGSTLRAAIAALRQLQVGKLIVVIPVGPPDTCKQLTREADALLCPHTPSPFYGVGQWYVEFGQTEDDEVQALLAQADQPHAAASTGQPPGESDAVV